MALDEFGRLRTSNCFTTFNYYPSAMSSNTTLDIDVWVSGQTGGAQSYNSQNYINMPYKYVCLLISMMISAISCIIFPLEKKREFMQMVF